MKFNKVTEKPFLGPQMWLVSAEWRGGHDRRVIRLMNLHDTLAAAETEWDSLTVEAHRRDYSQPADFDPGFLRHPIRMFREFPA